MKKTQLGEFEEIVLLTIAVLNEEAYGIAIKKEIEDRINRGVSIGALQTAFKRMEDKGFVSSILGEPTQKRGGKRKRYYSITSYGLKTLDEIRDIRAQLWSAIPQTILDYRK
ncbi:PadR family transcriptional regulator [Ekhidna sp.]